MIPGFGFFSAAYQSYLTSHARTGDPNRFKKTWNIPPAITWPRAEMSGDQDGIAKVLRAGNLGFGLKDDEQVSKERCGFWTDVVAAVTGLGGEFFLPFLPFLLSGGYVAQDEGEGVVRRTWANKVV